MIKFWISKQIAEFIFMLIFIAITVIALIGYYLILYISAKRKKRKKLKERSKNDISNSICDTESQN